MIVRNSGKSEDDRLKNRFTAYLKSAVQNRRIDYMKELSNRAMVNEFLSQTNIFAPFDVEKEAFKNVPLLIRLENDMLLSSLMELNDRELYILLKRTADDISFEKLADSIGMTYKGVSAAYYRVLQKVRRIIKEKSK